jgi:hypothetical protein
VAIFSLLSKEPFLGTVDDLGINIGETRDVRQEPHGIGSECRIRRTVAPITEPAAGLAVVEQTVIAEAVADRLSISENTVKGHLKSIVAKLSGE